MTDVRKWLLHQYLLPLLATAIVLLGYWLWTMLYHLLVVWKPMLWGLVLSWL